MRVAHFNSAVTRASSLWVRRSTFGWTSTVNLATFICCLLCFTPLTRAATPEQVDAALEKAKAFLYSQQRNGLWESTTHKPSDAAAAAAPSSVNGGQWGGPTALAVYALLASGESPTDPRLVGPINFLLTAEIRGTYALGLRAQLYTFLPPTSEHRLAAQADVARLCNAMLSKDPAKGLFDYALNSVRSTRFDHSVSQYGVLGAWACQRAGAEVPTLFWQTVENAWIRDQDSDGAWCYGRTIEQRPVTASMVVAGIATLFITQDSIHANNGLNCNGNISNPHIEAGLKWLDANFEEVFTDTGSDAPYYALYGVERVGVASGRKYLGTVDWYQRGADFLVKNQGAHGNWGTQYQTAFAMLFLSRGRAPVIFNKLQYNTGTVEGNWNERPRDIANLTRWIGKQTERDLNWQIVNLSGTGSDLLDAPVLYISGNKALQFSAAEEAKLREYCENGGLILGNADCGSSDFATSFRKLGSHLFHAYEFRSLPAKHPLFTAEQYPRSKWKPAPLVLGLSNGVRELMLLAGTSDPARDWQVEEVTRNLAEYQLPDDIVLYAIGTNNLLEKGRTFAVTPDEQIKPTRTVKLARLQWAGNWNPEPGGWRRMAAILHNSRQIQLDVSVARLGSNQLGNGKGDVKLASLTGTNTVQLNAPQRQEIVDFVNGGGTLIVDAAGGDTDFASSIEAELTTMFGADAAKQLKTPLPPTADIYKLPNGASMSFVYRPYSRRRIGSIHDPLLSVITVNNRPAVYFSRLDLSAGLVGQPTDGIVGYDPATATAIMTSLIGVAR
jgi:hypothetical protein